MKIKKFCFKTANMSCTFYHLSCLAIIIRIHSKNTMHVFNKILINSQNTMVHKKPGLSATLVLLEVFCSKLYSKTCKIKN